MLHFSFSFNKFGEKSRYLNLFVPTCLQVSKLKLDESEAQ